MKFYHEYVNGETHESLKYHLLKNGFKLIAGDVYYRKDGRIRVALGHYMATIIIG